MEMDEPLEPVPTEPAEPAEPTEPVEATEALEAVVPAEPKPRRIRATRAPKARAQATPSEPLTLEIDGTFWAGLLRTQREAERATRLQRISDFKLL